MGLNPVSIENFPGLDLRADPGDSRAAIDLMNVTLDPGRVRTRDGSAVFFNPALSVTTIQPFNSQMIVCDTTNFSAVDNTGTLIAATAGVAAGNIKGAALGTTAGSFFYIPTNAGVMKQWNGAAWSSPAGFPANGVLVGTMPADNRLVVADVGSKVWFSDPGAPTVYGANNFVVLTPGDGENIMAIATYNNQVFVFKKTKFFVFYGNSADAAGNPVFNYRAVDTGSAAARFGSGYHQHSVCVGDDGVYFMGRDGVYRTTGGPPQKFSEPLTPYFTYTTGPFWQGNSWQSTTRPNYDMTWCNSKLYVSVTTPTVSGQFAIVFVYDRATGTWSAWDFNAQCLCAYTANAADLRETLAAGKGTSNNVVRFDPTLTTDSGSAIVSRYRLPFEDYGSPRRKRLRETILEGTGTVTAQWSKDWGALTTGSSVVLGTSPAIATARQRLAMLGNSFSLQLGASSGAWSVNRVQANVSDALAGPEITV
jgi:hypothetical protein